MSLVLVHNGVQIAQRGLPPLRFRNGQSPTGAELRELADMAHTLMARRCRTLFSKYVKTRYTTADSTDRTTVRFACRTGPFTTWLRFVTVGYPASSHAANESKCYWVAETGLTGSGTTTTGDEHHSAAIYTAHAADNFWMQVDEFAVTPDTYYRFTLHQVNAYAVQSVVVHEEVRAVLDTETDTGVIDTTKIADGQPITGGSGSQLNELLAAADMIWKRGPRLWAWSVDGASPLAITATTAANVIDGSTTPTSTTLGHPIEIPHAGSLNSSDVGVVFWLNAYVSNALATGTVTLRNQIGTILATISVTATSATWYSTTCNLQDASGGVETTRLEVYASVTSTYTLNLHAFGVFVHGGSV